ncbi:NAD(P)/FAD-dependent oxidoreductase [Candidatus Lokiarchaeum ossiferum]|uniref:NAD(P)/FAD-dependent oxidoreductase n=1 Tax=Candidatus Lokiarchaeum ossiferum TaxID=2951803 RepID=UPI00352E2743
MIQDHQSNSFDVIVIGAGPAGLSAAIYLSRAGLSTLIVDESAPAGGQVKTTSIVANYPGFIEPISGLQLASNMKEQAEIFGTKFELASDITDYCFKDEIKWIEIDEDEKFYSKFILVATGSSPRLLGLPGEKELRGNGLSYCATCDGEFYKNKDIFVIGGGNSAMEESLLLLKHVRSLTVIHQFDHLQAEKITADKVLSNPKVQVLWSHEPRSFNLEGDKISVEIEDLKTGEKTTISRDGVFIFVGMLPNSDFLLNRPVNLALNSYHYIKTDLHMKTNLSGVYAAGDIRDKSYRQITTAVADGTIAALEIIKNS